MSREEEVGRMQTQRIEEEGAMWAVAQLAQPQSLSTSRLSIKSEG